MTLTSASAQLSFTSGVNPLAGPNADYAAVRYFNFSNAGGTGEFAFGTQNNLLANNYLTWSSRTYSFFYTYDPIGTFCGTFIYTAGEGIGGTIAVPSQPASELQIVDMNTGSGDLILTLTSIDSVANGTETFASGTTWSAANGATLQAYLDSPTLFSSGFTLYGTITLGAPANSANYGDNLNGLIEFNLSPVPEPSTGLVFSIGVGALTWLRRKHFSS